MRLLFKNVLYWRGYGSYYIINSNLKLLSSIEALEEKRKRIEQAKYEAGMKCRIEIQDDTIVEVNEDAQLHFVKFETRQIEKCLDYIRDTLMMSEHFTQVKFDFYLTFTFAEKNCNRPFLKFELLYSTE